MNRREFLEMCAGLAASMAVPDTAPAAHSFTLVETDELELARGDGFEIAVS